MLTLKEEILLLALHDDKGSLVMSSSEAINYALVASIIMELLLSNKIEIVDKKVFLTDSILTADAIIDDVIKKISRTSKPKSIKHWISSIASSIGGVKNIRKRISEQLVLKGILRKVEKRALGIFPYTSFPTEDPSSEENIRMRVREVILHEREPDEKMMVLIGLIHVCRLEKEIFEKRELKEARKKIKSISKNETLSSVVSETLSEINAVAAVMIASTIAVSTSSS